MRTRIWQVSLAVMIPLAALLFGGFVTSQAMPLTRTTDDALLTHDKAAIPEIQARRIISIPFGIDDVLAISDSGQTVEVTGHAECPDGGETYKIVVTVSQDATGTHAQSHVDNSCDVISWATTAETPGPHTFAPGAAEACGKAVIHVSKGGTITYRWCKDVTLQ